MASLEEQYGAEQYGAEHDPYGAEHDPYGAEGDPYGAGDPSLLGTFMWDCWVELELFFYICTTLYGLRCGSTGHDTRRCVLRAAGVSRGVRASRRAGEAHSRTAAWS